MSLTNEILCIDESYKALAAAEDAALQLQRRLTEQAASLVSKTDELCIKNEELCIKKRGIVCQK